MPRCGALSLLQIALNYGGGPAETAAGLNAKLWVLVVVVVVVVTGGEQPLMEPNPLFESI